MSLIYGKIYVMLNKNNFLRYYQYVQVSLMKLMPIYYHDVFVIRIRVIIINLTIIILRFMDQVDYANVNGIVFLYG